MEVIISHLVAAMAGGCIVALGMYRLLKRDPGAFAEAAAIIKAKTLTPEQLARVKAKVLELVSQA